MIQFKKIVECASYAHGHGLLTEDQSIYTSKRFDKFYTGFELNSKDLKNASTSDLFK
jgi:hypothetical protein